MGQADAVGDGEAEAGAPLAAVRAGPPEAFKHPGQLLRAEPNPRISNRNRDQRATTPGLHGHRAPGGGVALGIVKQVAQQPLQQGHLTLDQQLGFNFCFKLLLAQAKSITMLVKLFYQ